jgi:hypothetical protein
VLNNKLTVCLCHSANLVCGQEGVGVVQISILAGTIARIDRDAPRYGKGYNDFNTVSAAVNLLLVEGCNFMFGPFAGIASTPIVVLDSKSYSM